MGTPTETRSATSWDTIAHQSHAVSGRHTDSLSVMSFSLFYRIKMLILWAIGHCRRRKIRCLVDANDPEGRCENCIRLRKDCHFFPVDQQPPVERRSRPNSRLESAQSASTDPSTTSSSPPNIAGGSDQSESFFAYQPMPLDASQDASGFQATSFPGNPMSSFVPGRQAGSLC